MRPVEDRPSAPSRKTSPEKNALLVASLLLTAATANIILNLLNLTAGPAWQPLASAFALAALLAVGIVAVVLIRRKRVNPATHLLIAAIIAIFLARTLLNQGLGLVLGLGAIIVTSIVAFLILPPRQAGNLIIVGLFFSAAIPLADLYWPFARPLPSPTTLIAAYSTVAVFAIIFLIVLVSKFRHFSLYLKLLTSITYTAMLAVILTGVISYRQTRSALTSAAEQALLGSARQTAISLETFTSINLDAIRTEAQSPAFREYLSALSSEEQSSAAERAITTLQALGRKDQVFVKSYALLDRQGINVIDTDEEEIGVSEAAYDYFTRPLETGVPYASPVYVSDDGKAYLVFSSPVRNTLGEIIGVLRVRYDASVLQQIVAQQNELAGETSFGILLDENNLILANGMTPTLVLKTLSPPPPDRLTALQAQGRMPAGAPEEISAGLLDLEKNLNTGKTSFEFGLSGIPGDVETAVVTTVAGRPWKVVFVQDEKVFLVPVQQQARSTALVAISIILIATLAAFGLSRVMTTPVQNLTQASEQITAGNLAVRARVETEDEIGALANAFNAMTARLRDMIENLELRVAERTRDIERRAVLLQAAAEVGHSAASTRDLNILLTQITHLISQRFGFYHVGIFLLDERGEYAVLRAANSKGGQRMLERGHKLRVGQTGIVGYVTARGEARIALDVGDDAVFFDNPDLPQTRSEMALPLIASGVILGALDVQSEQPGAFTQEDITTLQVMANQIAIAIENARLFAESQAALEATRRAYGEVSRKGWQQWLRERGGIGYAVLAADKIVPASAEGEKGFEEAIRSGQTVRAEDGATIFVPLRVRGEVLGALRLEKPPAEPWTESDLALANTLTDQLSAALESARLFEETATRAERERAVSEITTRIRSATDPQTMLQIAMEELKQVLGVEEVRLRPLSPSKEQEAPSQPQRR